MPISFNGTTLSVGEKQYVGSTHVKDIIFNGVNVYHYDSTPPTITITSASGTTANSTYTITGTVVDSESGVSSVKVNGNTASLSGNTFSYTIGLSYGKNNISVVATDKAGNSASTSMVIYRYNSSVITWGDTITMNLNIIGYYNGGKTGPNYTGNRNSKTCTVYGSVWGAGAGASDGSGSWAGTEGGTISCTGRIYAGATNISITRGTSGTPTSTYGYPETYYRIYNSAGNVVANLSEGSNNISAYSDGSYYFSFATGHTNYGASTINPQGVSLNVAIS